MTSRERKEKEDEKREEENEKENEGRGRRKREGKERECVGSKRLRVNRQNARMCSTCERFAGTHGGVLNQHTEAL